MIRASNILESILSISRIDERNVVNTEDIEPYISHFIRETENSQIKKWLQSVLRNYLINDYPGVSEVDPSRKEYARLPWISQAINRGDTLYKVSFPPQLDAQINHIIDYFEYVLTTEDEIPNNLYLRDLSRISYQDAFDKAELWTHWLSKRKSLDTDDPDEGEFEVLKLSDGFSIYQVVSPSALNREGSKERMYHCVGSYAKEVASNKSKIYSLRDRNNCPYCTLELVGKQIEQIKGYHDGKVEPRYRKYVVDFLNYGLEKNWFNRIKGLRYIDAILYNGIVYKEEDAPDEYKARIELLISSKREDIVGIRNSLDRVADVNIADSSGWTPLHYASRIGYTEIVELLLNRYADPNLVANSGMTALHVASNKDIAALLLKHNADPDLADNNGWTPLGYASTIGRKDIVEILLKHNANPNIANNRGWTPLFSASNIGRKDIVDLLKQYGAKE
jgi:hypothetical protein